MGDVTKLPKWAQEKITNLTHERDVARERLNAFRAGQPKSHVAIVQESGIPMYLPENTTVRFYDDNRFHVDVVVNASNTGKAGNAIKLYGAHPLAIHPQSANYAWVGEGK